MPRLHQPPSMKKRAMQVVAEHFDTICYGAVSPARLRNMMDDDTYTLVESPMAFWPPDLLDEMMETVAERRALKRTILHHLIQPHLESFSLPCGVGDVYFAVAFITDRCCQNLQKLDLSYISYLGPNLLVKLVSNLPRIRIVNFRMTPVTDQVLGQMGMSCPELRHLDISSTPVTDAGLERLSRSDWDGEPGATRLARLSVLDTNITQYGLAVILHNCQQLRHVEHENLFQAFVHFDADAERLPLVGIRATRELDDAECFTTAVGVCPKLESVALVASGAFSESALWSLTNLAHLTELTLANGPDAFVLDFYANVAPILQTIGNQLLNLILTRFTCVDTSAIGANCAKLRNLALSEICHFVEPDAQQRQHGAVFTQVQAVELWSLAGVRTPASVVKQLTAGSAHVRNLLFRNCHCIDDAFFTEMVDRMPSLSHVTLDGCPNVTLNALLALVQHANDVSMIRLWNLPQINRDDYAALASAVRTGNMDVFVDWYPCDEST